MKRTEANKNALRSLLDRFQDINEKEEDLKKDAEAISQNPIPGDEEQYEKLVEDIEHFRELSKVIEDKIIDLLK